MLLMKIAQELFFRGAYWGNFNGHTEIAVVEVLLQKHCNSFQPSLFCLQQYKIGCHVWSLNEPQQFNIRPKAVQESRY